MIEFIEGDMFADATADAIAHGCNCKGFMGAGVAARVRELYPDAYAAYRAVCEAGLFQLGSAQKVGRVWNLATQYDPGPFARLAAIDRSVRAMVAGQGTGVVAMPRIGAGIGGLPWSEVRTVITRAAERSPSVLVRVYEWSPR